MEERLTDFDELDDLDSEPNLSNEEIKSENCVQAYAVDSFSAVSCTSDTFDAITSSSARKIADDVVNKGKDVKTGMKEAMAVRSTFNVAKDEGFQSELDAIKREEIKSEFQADKIEATVRKEDAKRARNETFYKAFRPILEFDFSNITGKEKKNPKTYDDRSYGLIVMVIMVSILLVPFVATTLVLAALTIINLVFEYASTFSKPALKFCIWTSLAGLVVLVGYLILSWIETRFGIPILHDPSVALLLNYLQRGNIWVF